MKKKGRRGRAYILLRVDDCALNGRKELLEYAHLIPLWRRILNGVPVEHFLKEPCLNLGPLEERDFGPSHLRRVQELEILCPEDLQGLQLTWRGIHGRGLSVQRGRDCGCWVDVVRRREGCDKTTQKNWHPPQAVLYGFQPLV